MGDNDKYGYVYILQHRDYLGTSIYKIGRTNQEHNKRVSSYPKGSVLKLQVECYNSVVVERNIIELFNKNYELQINIGSEYFSGNLKNMKQDIFELAQLSINEIEGGNIKTEVKNNGLEKIKEDSLVLIDNTKLCIPSLVFEKVLCNSGDYTFIKCKIENIGIIMMDNGYINVTKLCNAGGKELKHWKETANATRFIKEVKRVTGIENVLIMLNEGYPSVLRGTYAHSYVVTHIACWISPQFAIMVSRIVDGFYKIKLEEL